MKNKNEVTGNLLLGCTVLRITREVPGAITIFLLELEHAAGMPGYRFQPYGCSTAGSTSVDPKFEDFQEARNYYCSIVESNVRLLSRRGRGCW